MYAKLMCKTATRVRRGYVGWVYGGLWVVIMREETDARPCHQHHLQHIVRVSRARVSCFLARLINLLQASPSPKSGSHHLIGSARITATCRHTRSHTHHDVVHCGCLQSSLFCESYQATSVSLSLVSYTSHHFDFKPVLTLTNALPIIAWLPSIAACSAVLDGFAVLINNMVYDASRGWLIEIVQVRIDTDIINNRTFDSIVE